MISVPFPLAKCLWQFHSCTSALSPDMQIFLWIDSLCLFFRSTDLEHALSWFQGFAEANPSFSAVLAKWPWFFCISISAWILLEKASYFIITILKINDWADSFPQFESLPEHWPAYKQKQQTADLRMTSDNSDYDGLHPGQVWSQSLQRQRQAHEYDEQEEGGRGKEEGRRKCCGYHDHQRWRDDNQTISDGEAMRMCRLTLLYRSLEHKQKTWFVNMKVGNNEDQVINMDGHKSS